MCGRLSQYSGIHDFVAALSMPNALANSVCELPLERFNVALSTQVALLHLQGDLLDEVQQVAIYQFSGKVPF
jgi:hypothetical protein